MVNRYFLAFPPVAKPTFRGILEPFSQFCCAFVQILGAFCLEGMRVGDVHLVAPLAALPILQPEDRGHGVRRVVLGVVHRVLGAGLCASPNDLDGVKGGGCSPSSSLEQPVSHFCIGKPVPPLPFLFLRASEKSGFDCFHS